jgi:hypothetical protein
MASPTSTEDKVLSLRNSKIASTGRFSLTVAASLILSTALYTVAAHFIGKEFSGVTRRLDTSWQIAGLVAWRTIELGVSWLGSYSSKLEDVRSLPC